MCCSKRNKKIVFSFRECSFVFSIKVCQSIIEIELKTRLKSMAANLYYNRVQLFQAGWNSMQSSELVLITWIVHYSNSDGQYFKGVVYDLVCGLHSWKYLRRSRTKVVQAGCLWTILYPRPRARGWVLSVSHVQHVRNTTSDRNVSYSWSLWPSHEQPLTSGMLGKLFTEEIEGPELFI